MITAVIITKNEEEVVKDAIESLKDFADEVLVIDDNSTDKTTDIAKKLGAKVIPHTFENFAEQRNVSLKHAKNNWLFYLDADERLTPEFKEEALSKISSFLPSSNIAGYYIRRKTFYFNRDWGLTDRVQRLFYKEKLKEWRGVVHETPQVDGEFDEILSPILHFTHRNLEQMIKKTNNWSEFEAELRFKAHHPKMTWWRFPRVMLSEFLRSYIREKGYKNGTEGIMESIYQSYSMFITYAKLWELQNSKR